MAEHNARLNKLVANFGDIEARRKLIAEFGNSDSAFMGENQDGEDIMIFYSTILFGMSAMHNEIFSVERD